MNGSAAFPRLQGVALNIVFQRDYVGKHLYESSVIAKASIFPVLTSHRRTVAKNKFKTNAGSQFFYVQNMLKNTTTWFVN